MGHPHDGPLGLGSPVKQGGPQTSYQPSASSPKRPHPEGRCPCLWASSRSFPETKQLPRECVQWGRRACFTPQHPYPLTPLESASQTYSRALSEQLAPFTQHKTPGLFQSFLAIAPGSKPAQMVEAEPAGRGQTGTRGRPEPWLASDLVNLDQDVGFLRCWGGAMPSRWELGHPAVTYLHVVLPLLQLYYENPLKETNYFK